MWQNILPHAAHKTKKKKKQKKKKTNWQREDVPPEKNLFSTRFTSPSQHKGSGEALTVHWRHQSAIFNLGGTQYSPAAGGRFAGFLLTQCFHQQLDAVAVARQCRAHTPVDGHVGQYPHQFHQHVVGLCRGGRRQVASALVGVVEPQQDEHGALALEELLPGLVHLGRQVSQGEEKPHHQVLQEITGT